MKIIGIDYTTYVALVESVAEKLLSFKNMEKAGKYSCQFHLGFYKTPS